MHFLLDGMLGKLARWLRMIGYEAIYMNDSADHDLLSIAKGKSMILLTSDEELYRTATARGIDSFLVKGRTEAERLAGLAKRYRLDLKIDTAISKCPVCGWALKEASKADVEGSVPPTTFKIYRSFWVCTNPGCAKVYWQGSHWKRIEQTLESAREILDNKKNVEPGRNKRVPKPRRGQSTRPASSSRHNEVPRREADPPSTPRSA